MSVRIPRPVNRTLDAVSTHPRAVVTAVVVAGIALPVAAALLSLTGAAAVAGGTALAYVLATVHRLRVSGLKEQIRQRDYDLAAERAQVERLSVGDPSAPTAQLRQIGETGELT